MERGSEQDVNDIESVVGKTADQGSLTLYCTYPVTNFLCTSVHHNNKQHNCGLRLFYFQKIWLCTCRYFSACLETRRIEERQLPSLRATAGVSTTQPRLYFRVTILCSFDLKLPLGTIKHISSDLVNSSREAHPTILPCNIATLFISQLATSSVPIQAFRNIALSSLSKLQTIPFSALSEA
jgi:hypothetical protein